MYSSGGWNTQLPPPGVATQQENAADRFVLTEHFSILREFRHDVQHVLGLHDLNTTHIDKEASTTYTCIDDKQARFHCINVIHVFVCQQNA